ncbi:uncharacterized protein DS421_3g105780 [Arachis hypogaea]|nr:uncharacterized protein DS421_3g105780 [Arachis hypogaea]
MSFLACIFFSFCNITSTTVWLQWLLLHLPSVPFVPSIAESTASCGNPSLSCAPSQFLGNATATCFFVVLASSSRSQGRLPQGVELVLPISEKRAGTLRHTFEDLRCRSLLPLRQPRVSQESAPPSQRCRPRCRYLLLDLSLLHPRPDLFPATDDHRHPNVAFRHTAKLMNSVLALDLGPRADFSSASEFFAAEFGLNFLLLIWLESGILEAAGVIDDRSR